MVNITKYINISSTIQMEQATSPDQKNKEASITFTTILPTDDPSYTGFDTAEKLFNNYLAHVVTAVGIVGNALSVAVILFSPRTRKSTHGLFLIVLAILDSLVLITSRLNAEAIPGGIPASHALCQSVNFLMLACQCAASLIVLCISGSRFLVIVYPFKSKWVSKFKNAMIASVSVVIFSLAASSYTLASITEDEEYCYFIAGRRPVFAIGVIIVQILIGDFIGGTCIIILSILTVMSLRKSKKNLFGNDSSDAALQRKKNEAQISRMLITLCVSYVLLRLPYTIVYVITVMFLEGMITLSDEAFLAVMKVSFFTGILSLMNHAVNFFLYCISGRSFRADFLNMILCKKPEDKLTAPVNK